LLALCLAAAGCPEHGSSSSSETLPPCKEVGQRCMFAPGKFGSCVLRDNCAQSDCYVCQSQH